MPAHPTLRFFAALFLCGCMYIGFVSAQEKGETKKEPAAPPPVKDFELPKVLKENRAPANVEELRQIEKHVKKVLDKVMPAVVGVRVGMGQGSGVIIREDGTILTAGHVSGEPKKPAAVILPTGKFHKGTTLGKNGGIDSGMMKISDEGKYPFLEMGKSAELKPGQWVIAIGHPGGFRPNRTPVVRVGRVLMANQFVIQTDCTLVGGDSGGPLFDMQGRVVGIHSRIGGFAISQNMHVPVDVFRREWDKLARGEKFGGQLGQTQTVNSAGGKLVFEKKDALDNKDPKDKVQVDSHAKLYTFRMKAGHTYTLDLISGDKSGKALDTFLRLESPDGKQIAQDDDGGSFPHSRIVYKALKEGDYRVLATSFEANQTGKYTLKIYDADFVDAVVAGKVDLLRTVKVPFPAIPKLIDMFGKAKAPLHVNVLVIDNKGDPLANKEVTFQWESGKETLKSDKDGVVRWPLALAKSRKLALELPKDVRAMVALTNPEGTSIGLKEDKSVEKVKSAGGAIVKTFDGKLAKTDPFDLEREKCYRHNLEFKMVAGKTYTLDLVSDDFDAYLRVETDDKGKLAEDDDSGGFLNSRIVFTPEATETFRLVVTTCDPGDFGAYRLTIRETNAVKSEPKKVEKK